MRLAILHDPAASVETFAKLGIDLLELGAAILVFCGHE